MRVSKINETKSAVPRADFDSIKDFMLGGDYKLNLIVTSSEKIRKLNLIYRDLDEPTDILSFPISHNEGDIYISPTETKKKSPEFGMKYEKFFVYLFIHGCAHLKGMAHGRKMEMFESETMKRFGVL